MKESMQKLQGLVGRSRFDKDGDDKKNIVCLQVLRTKKEKKCSTSKINKKKKKHYI
jgi:hypothetical protein